MKRKHTRILIVLLTLIMCVVTLCACNGASKYHAEFFYDLDDCMTSEFLDENRTNGAIYAVDYFNSEINQWDKKYITVENAPKTREIIINDAEQFSAIFKDFPTDIDFEKQILVLYMYTDTSPRPAVLRKISLVDGNLKVEFALKSPRGMHHINDSTEPDQKCVGIKMDRADINSIEFVKQR